MNENLEQFIIDHRHEFDQIEQVDSASLWREIQSTKKPTNGKHIWSVVVFIGMGLLLSAYVSMYTTGHKQDDWTIPNLELHDPELAKYQDLMIESVLEQEQIMQALSIDKNEFKDILHSLDQLDTITKQYKLDLKEKGPSPQIIKALMRCAKQRVHLYELLLYKYELKKYQDELNLQS